MKKQFLKKLKSNAGETLVETLFAILIATFASILLASSTSTAIELNRQARERDEINQKCLEQLALASADPDHSVSENSVKVQEMEWDASTGKLVEKKNGDDEPIFAEVSVGYTDCNVGTAEHPKAGDFSTYALLISGS